MYFSAEQLALVNQAVKETFEQCSVAWQAIPHWNTGDPGQTMSQMVNPAPPGLLSRLNKAASFTVTLAQAIAPTPDELLTVVIANTVDLAKER